MVKINPTHKKLPKIHKNFACKHIHGQDRKSTLHHEISTPKTNMISSSSNWERHPRLHTQRYQSTLHKKWCHHGDVPFRNSSLHNNALGCWSSNAFLCCIWKQEKEFSKGISKKMLTKDKFFTIPTTTSDNPHSRGHSSKITSQNNGPCFNVASRSLVKVFHWSSLLTSLPNFTDNQN